MRRHPFDIHGLVWGVLALGAAGWWLLERTTTVDASVALVLPIALIVAGLLGVVASLLRRDRGDVVTPHTDPLDTHTDTDTDTDTKELP